MPAALLRAAGAVLLATPLLAHDNVLLLLADDLGVDRVAAYGEHPVPGLTPNLDQLAAQGVLFRNCWSNPYCSPTRATIFTGRYCFRTGVGWYVNPWWDHFGILPGEWTLPRAIRAGSQGLYRTGYLGKWHLAGTSQGKGHPNVAGWERYRGSPNNLVNGQDYWHWERVSDGMAQWADTYATTQTVDDALELIAGFGDEPWFVSLGFHAPHAPLHAPPDALHGYTLSGDPNDTPVEHTLAMVQALDTEIGRLLASIDPAVLARTTILFLGDNGTASEASTPPFVPAHAKPTLFEGGINVPLIVAGSRVSAPGTECQALVNTTDVFATVCELAGVPAGPPAAGILWRSDSVSVLPYLADPARPPLRSHVYAEKFLPLHGPPFTQHQRAIRGARYKLVQDVNKDKLSLYDLEADPFEMQDLLKTGQLDGEQQAALQDLLQALQELLASP